jgi:ATP-dependent helicase/nuclease subunit B
MLDAPRHIVGARQPSPRVPASLQPTRLSVTEAETLLRDPYAIFARKVLGLDALEPLGLDFDPGLQGSLWHEAIEAFTRSHPAALPPAAYEDLLAIGRELLGEHMRDPRIEGFVWPRFKRAARWFLDWERGRRGDIAAIAAETPAMRDIPLGDTTIVHLTARPDRVERRHDGTLAIVDFKTGTVPSQRDVLDGFSPQLTLEAAIIGNGGMPDVPAASVRELLHVRLTGGAEAGKATAVKPRDGGFPSVDALAEAHFAGLADVLRSYRRGERGFTAHPFPGKAPVFSAYGHLARVAEWADDSAPEGEAP